jgi:hypothetical protein
VPLPVARYCLGRAVEGFFQTARGFNPDDEDRIPPPVHGIKVGVGIGKSVTGLREAASFVGDLRAAGDPRTLIMAVPTHKLGEQLARKFKKLPAAQAAGLRAAVWRGREADDPAVPGQTMCLDLDAIRDAQAVGARPDTAACHNRDAQRWCCPFHPSNPDRPANVPACRYQLQKQQQADTWFTPHEVLFGEKPDAMGKPAAVMVDEAAWRKGLEGLDDRPLDLTLDAITRDVEIPGDVQGADTQNLQHVHTVLADALPRLPLGRVCQSRSR